jgi:hypothetical protein
MGAGRFARERRRRPPGTMPPRPRRCAWPTGQPRARSAVPAPACDACRCRRCGAGPIPRHRPSSPPAALRPASRPSHWTAWPRAMRTGRTRTCSRRCPLLPRSPPSGRPHPCGSWPSPASAGSGPARRWVPRAAPGRGGCPAVHRGRPRAGQLRQPGGWVPDRYDSHARERIPAHCASAYPSAQRGPACRRSASCTSCRRANHGHPRPTWFASGRNIHSTGHRSTKILAIPVVAPANPPVWPLRHNGGVSSRSRALIFAAVVIVGGTIAGRLLGYNLGGHTVVRCRQGHLFTTVWIPGVKLKALDLGVARIQRCPVGKHWTLVTPVRTSALTEAEKQVAREHRDVRIP